MPSKIHFVSGEHLTVDVPAEDVVDALTAGGSQHFREAAIFAAIETSPDTVWIRLEAVTHITSQGTARAQFG